MDNKVMNPVPTQEFDRVLELSEFNLDYTELQDEFKDLTNLAAKVARTDISLINLIDSFTQWSIASHGSDVKQMPRDETVCQYTIMDNQPFEISDLSKDHRFKDRDYVTGEPNLRYYYGIPLTTKTGHQIGALCVMDKSKKQLSPEKVEMLKIIANEVVKRLTFYKHIEMLQNKLNSAAEANIKLSHDIRGPLGGIIGLADIIKDEGEKNKINDIIKLAKMIKKGGKSLLDLADEILSIENDDEHREPKSHEFNLITLRTKLNELYTPQAEAKDIDLTIANHSENEDIPFPKNKIVQILGNLISNAIKFTPKGGMVMVRQEFENTDDQKRLKFIVKDSGAGISQDKIECIMDGSAKSTKGTEGETGYGFGLSLVVHLIRKMNGQIEIESEEGKGCQFNILLPVSE